MRARQLLLGQFPKKVRLVLLKIAAAKQSVTIRRFVILNARIVAGRNFLAAETRRQSVKRSKLQTAVAGDAGNRSFAVEITGDERLHHVALKFAFQIQHVKRKAQLFRHAARVVNIVERTTTRRKRIAVLVHTDAARWFHNCIVKPTSSWPCSFRIAAAAEESTPPLHCYCYLHQVSGFRLVSSNVLECRKVEVTNAELVQNRLR